MDSELGNAGDWRNSTPSSLLGGVVEKPGEKKPTQEKNNDSLIKEAELRAREEAIKAKEAELNI